MSIFTTALSLFVPGASVTVRRVATSPSFAEKAVSPPFGEYTSAFTVTVHAVRPASKSWSQ